MGSLCAGSASSTSVAEAPGDAAQRADAKAQAEAERRAAAAELAERQAAEVAAFLKAAAAGDDARVAQMLGVELDPTAEGDSGAAGTAKSDAADAPEVGAEAAGAATRTSVVTLELTDHAATARAGGADADADIAIDGGRADDGDGEGEGAAARAAPAHVDGAAAPVAPQAAEPSDTKATLSSLTPARAPSPVPPHLMAARGARRQSPVHSAAKHGHGSTVALLLRAGFTPDARDDAGLTPLCQAAAHGSTQCVRALLEGGADATLVDDSLSGPLHHACRFGGTDDSFRLLVTALGDGPAGDTTVAVLSRPNRYGDTILHAAAASGHLDVLRAVVESLGPSACAALLSVANSTGNTPLDVAASHEARRIIKPKTLEGGNIR